MKNTCKNLSKFVLKHLFLVFIVSPLLLTAQTLEMKGRLRDAQSQKVIDGANITLKGTSHGEVSVGGGFFKFENLAEDKYTMFINQPGYISYQQLVELKDKLDLGTIFLVKTGAAGTGAALQQAIRATNIINLFNERPNLMGGNMIYGITPEGPKVEGDNYLDSKWNSANLLLYKEQKLLEGVRIRYNITSNLFEVLSATSNQITIMPGIRIQNVVWVDSAKMVPRYFVNGMDFLDEGAPISGFFEVLVDGQLPLMRRTKAVFKESNYNTALMVGNRNHQILKRNTYYYLQGKNVIEVPTNRKKLFAIFEEKSEEIKEYVNSNELSVNNPNTIFQVFTHYNSKYPDFKPIMNQLLEESN